MQGSESGPLGGVFKRFLAGALTQKGFSQTDVARELGISVKTVHNWFSGSVARPHARHLAKLAKLCGLEEWELRAALRVSDRVDAETAHLLDQPPIARQSEEVTESVARLRLAIQRLESLIASGEADSEIANTTRRLADDLEKLVA